ncbi:MAG: helix-turn-helix transcriptional regulator [Actinomycetota bacterium]|nr:helix-turn-helix transcriptional regulator [Actinomycetota bacterium]
MSKLERRIAESVDSVEYQVEDLILSLTGEFLDRMEQTDVSRADLARRIGVKPPRITRILQGNDNFTLKTLVGVADALDCKLVFTLAPCGTETKWKHYYRGGASVAQPRSTKASPTGDYTKPFVIPPIDEPADMMKAG